MQRIDSTTWVGLGGSATINPRPHFISDATGRRAIPVSNYFVHVDGISEPIGTVATLADAAQLLRDRRRS